MGNEAGDDVAFNPDEADEVALIVAPLFQRAFHFVEFTLKSASPVVCPVLRLLALDDSGRKKAVLINLVAP